MHIYLLWKCIEHKKYIFSISKEVIFHDFLFLQNFVGEEKKPWYNKQKANTPKPGIQSKRPKKCPEPSNVPTGKLYEELIPEEV